jgi:hypothetical protein
MTSKVTDHHAIIPQLYKMLVPITTNQVDIIINDLLLFMTIVLWPSDCWVKLPM